MSRWRGSGTDPAPQSETAESGVLVTAPSQIRRYFEALLLLLLAAGFFTLAGTGRLGGVVVLLGGAALAARGVLWLRGIRPRLSNGFTNVVSALYLVFYPLDYFFLSHGFLTATVHLVLLVAVLKLFSANRPRDFAYLCVLAFLEVLAAATLTIGSGFLGYFVCFLVLTVATVISYELFRAESSAPVRAALAPAPGRSPAGGMVRSPAGGMVWSPAAGIVRSPTGGVRQTPARGMGPSTTLRLRGPLLSVSLAAAVSVAACGAALFFVLPRFSMGYWQPNAGQARLSGFSDDVQLGEIGRLQLSNRPVMHVRVESSLPPVVAGALEMYWTGRILTQFDGRDWYDPQHPLPTQTLFGQLQFPPGGAPFDYPRRVVRYRVMLEPVGSDVLFYAPRLLRISTRFRRLGIESTGTLTNENGAFGETGYSATSALGAPPAAELRGLGRDYPPRISARDLQLPPDLDPRIAVLAHRIVGRRRDPYAQMTALTRYLRTHYKYTLNLREGGRHPLASFLFRYRAGHCEYFASALAVMGRLLGIPTRVVNGFAGGEYNPVSGEYVLRGRDAHSWVQAYFPSRPAAAPRAAAGPAALGAALETPAGGGVWVRFDATPTSTLGSSWSRLSQYADALSSFWQEWVINYDIFHQLSLARGVGQHVRMTANDWRSSLGSWSVWSGVRGWRRRAGALAQWLASQGGRRKAGLGLALLALLAGLGWAIWTSPWTRRSRRSLPPHAAAAQATGYYRRLRGLLERSGFRTPPQCTPEELASALPPGGPRPAVRTAVGRFVAHYEQVRFGGEGALLPQLADDLHAVETALR